jgi:prophage regulatory protein
MPDRVLIPLPGIGTLSLTRAEYEAALIPIAPPEVAKPAPSRRAEPMAVPLANTELKPQSLGYLRLREVCNRVGVGYATIYRMIAAGEFPRQVKLRERTSVWVESEVDAFINARIAERDQPIPTPAASPYLRMGEVMRLTRMNNAMIYAGVRAQTFPKWADLPKRGSGWLKTDVEAWLAARDARSKKS